MDQTGYYAGFDKLKRPRVGKYIHALRNGNALCRTKPFGEFQQCAPYIYEEYIDCPTCKNKLQKANNANS